MDLPAEAVSDLRVAAVAAGCAVALSVTLRYGVDVTASPLFELSPITVYFCYLFFGKGSTGSTFEDPRFWVVVTVVVTIATGGYLAV
jgi:hypothetical protein